MLPTPAPAAAETPLLILYTRQGCCLCEGLEERLRQLGLSAPRLTLIDVDGDPQLQSRYGLEVPVLAARNPDGGWRELPRVPPRLSSERLGPWLAQQGVDLTNADGG